MGSSVNGGTAFLYENAVGRMFLKVLTRRFVSRIAGGFMNSALSRPMIKGFIRRNGINMSDYTGRKYRSFNDFFTRELREGARCVDMSPSSFTAPCDGKLSAYRIDENSVFYIKNSAYTVADLLENEQIAHKYNGGTCLIFRLCVDNYHRYHYLDNGTKGENTFIKGELHTVRPIALKYCNIYKRNSREYTVMQTENFGSVTQVEVGAMMVGKIKNHHACHRFMRGEEKGMFLFGGSTVVLLIEKDKLELESGYFEKTLQGIETDVLMGQKLGVKKGVN